MQLTTSGTSLAPIVFRVAEGETARIVAYNASTPDGINLEGASHVVIEGFRVDGRGWAGIRAVLCEHVTIRGNTLDANERWGVLTGFCDDLLIEDNVASKSVIEHGIYVSNSGDRPVIRRNTILVASDGRWGINIQDGSSDNTVKNNIVFSRHGFRGAMDVCASCVSGLSSDHNVLEGRFTLDGGNSTLTLAEWQATTGQDSASVLLEDAAALDALFADAANDDYHLAAGAAVDAGEALPAAPTDLDGVARPVGGAWDAGCYEGVGVIFVDGFESGDSSRWDFVVP